MFVDCPIQYVSDFTTLYGARVEGRLPFPCHLGSWFNDGIVEASGQLDSHIITSVCPCLKVKGMVKYAWPYHDLSQPMIYTILIDMCPLGLTEMTRTRRDAQIVLTVAA